LLDIFNKLDKSEPFSHDRRYSIDGKGWLRRYGLLRSRKGNEDIWVIVDRLARSAHFIPIRSNRIAASLAQIYVRKFV